MVRTVIVGANLVFAQNREIPRIRAITRMRPYGKKGGRLDF